MGPVLAIGVNGLVLTMAVLKLLRPAVRGTPGGEAPSPLGVIKALLILTPIQPHLGLGLATLLEEIP